VYFDKDKNPYGDGVISKYVNSGFTWPNKSVTCKPRIQGGAGLSNTEMTLSTGDNIMHMITGGCPGDYFGKYPARFVPVYQLYSQGGAGLPADARSGIRLPHVAHNVVALGLVVESKQQSCPGK
jgi:hypothetical protein